MHLIDSHCHLSVAPLATHRSAVLARARAAGVREVVVPAFDLASWSDLEGLAGVEGVHLAFGLHPWYLDAPLDLARLRAVLIAHRAVAIGEIGLDRAIDHADLDHQREVLSAQLDLARELDLPVLLHCRGAFDELLALVAARPGLRGVVHAFSRGPELARRCVDLGLHVAFGGAVTRPRATRARRAACVVDAQHLLLETDAPSIGLEGVPAEQVEPAHTRQVAEAMAALRGVELDEVARLTTENARRLFALPGA